MVTKNIAWTTGTGNITVTYDGSGNGTITVTSDANNLHSDRSQSINVRTTDGSITRTVSISQAAKPYIDLSTAVVTASAQTYTGSALTPSVTVTLNGNVIPSSGYDVTYSNNTNAGTATITVTGKGDYTGTATGSFTINKASRTLSFSDVFNVVAPSSTITKTATPSAGSGDGAVTYSISSTTYATINSSTGAVTAKTSDGSAIVTATIAEGTNYLSASASYTLYVFATTHDFAYTGSEQGLLLPPGSYTLQTWGAQGGSNASDSYYGITAQEGGKGGYSIGVLSLSQSKTVNVYVGGQGSSSSGGYNGGGSTSGSASYNSGNEYGVSRMGGGGGATDIRLSDGALLSRMIVAGGGSGGAGCCQVVTSETTTWNTVLDGTYTASQLSGDGTYYVPDSVYGYDGYGLFRSSSSHSGERYKMSAYAVSGSMVQYYLYACDDNYGNVITGGDLTLTVQTRLFVRAHCPNSGDTVHMTVQKYETSSSTSYSYDSQEGYAGGGANGVGYSSYYSGSQTSAGSGGSFGQGAAQSTTNYRYCSGAGGGGWYGGGSGYSDSSTSSIRYMGGGSGWVNTSASAGNRPSGYTGLQLDSGTTYDGDTSFPSTSGSSEVGHSGNGYARITRLVTAKVTLTFKTSGGVPVEGLYATATCSSESYSITTNANGKATFTTVLNGSSKTFTISSDDYTLSTSQIVVSDSTDADITATEKTVWGFSYTGSVKSKTLKAGTYKIECWGAQGGSYNTTYYGGKGGYSVGEIALESQTTVYIAVGGQGGGGTSSGNKAGGFNGGGKGYSTSTTYVECGGGGASDVRIGQNSLYARVIVAGGGGGAGSYSSSYRYAGGAGGGVSGSTPSQYSTSYMAGTGGTATTRGNSYNGSTANSTTYGTLADFGVGAGAKSGTTSYQITGGGGGWYGGGYSRRGAGGGGSGYVYDASTASNYPSGCLLNSAYYLANAQTIAGDSSMPSTSGSTETGHAGSGYVKITRIS